MGTYKKMFPEQQKSSHNVTVQSDLDFKAIVVPELFTGREIQTGDFQIQQN